MSLGRSVGLKAKLADLGFSKGVIAETIVTTYDKAGNPNAAPIGVIMKDQQHILINLFNSTLTHNNIQANSCAVINLTNDIEIFYKTAFKEMNPGGKLPLEWFEKAKVVNAPRLLLADATIEVSTNNLISISENKTQAEFNLELVLAKLNYPQVHSRAMSQTLEAILHATRVKALLSNKKEKNRVSKLLEIIANCNETVNRVAPNSKYSLIMSDLMNRIGSWQEQK